MSEHVVAHRRDLPPGSRRIVTVEGREIGIFNVDGELHALGNFCADEGGPVCEGGLFPNIQARVEGRRIREYIQPRDCILACPWHGWEYDVRTGVALWNPRYRLRKYDVRQDAEGNVLVSI